MNQTEQNKHNIIQKILLSIQNNVSYNKNAFELNSDLIYFKNYMPVKFEKIRKACNITENEYTNAFKLEYFLKKSHIGKKSLLIYTENFRFVVKTIRKREKNVLLTILDDYIKYIKQKETMLSKIYGCYRIKSTLNGTFYLIVIDCMFNSPNIMHEIYDLKGSLYGRYAQNISHVTLKDCDWKAKNTNFLSNGSSEKIYSTIEKDVEFLNSHDILDYSLVLGIKYKEDTNLLRFYNFYTQESNNIEMVEDVSKVLKKSLPLNEAKKTTYISVQNNKKVFYNIGIVDFLTNWSIHKKLEYYFSICICKRNFSCINPKCYKDRFLLMAKEILCDNKNNTNEKIN